MRNSVINDPDFEAFKEVLGAKPIHTILHKRKTKDKEPSRKTGSTKPRKVSIGTRDNLHGLNCIAGMKELKAQVKRDFVDILKNKELAQVYGIKPAPILLYGAPGCGKTFFANKLAEEVNMHFMSVTPDDIADSYVHGTQQKIAQVFKKAVSKAPTLLFFDEFDSMVPDRSNTRYQNVSDEVSEFLTQLNNAADKGVYVITATNHPEAIDRAILRSGRIDHLVYIPLPDKDARKELFQLELANRPKAGNLSYDRLAELTDNYTASDITSIVKEAARVTFEEASKSKGNDVMPISQKTIEETISHKVPSVNDRDIRFYEHLKDEFSPKDKNARKTTVGFV